MDYDRRPLVLWCALLGAAAGSGCNQTAPPVDEGSSGEVTASSGSSDTGMATIEGDYHPLVDGAWWTYRHTTVDNAVWDEEVTMRAVTWNGREAFEQSDNAGQNGENTTSILVREGTAVLRVHKLVELGGAPIETADYEPGFLRFDHGWTEGQTQVWQYRRIGYDASGAVIDDSPRNQAFTVESLSVEVTVPAGTFDCVQVLRERLENGELRRFWFADGVGKVKHETLDSGATEELAAYSIP